MKRIARSAILERSAEALYALVEDIESYPRFVPHCIAAHVHERSTARTVATLVFALPRWTQSLTTENENLPGRSIRMRLREGPFRHFDAAWHFVPLGPGASRIEFSMEYEFANRVAARALAPFFERMADTLVEAFRARAEQRQ